ncbi:hypothetical protein F4802DRAFT_611210 [Xylaria palmicola]|nr:hypothetical protein F4802DRAFT_611210 [Xylaria palmicola]
MDTLNAGRKAKRAYLPRIPTDEVLHVFYFDDTPMLWNAVMCWMMRFHDVLDPIKLHQSLDRLLRRDDGWRKLRGRIRLNEHGRLEIHVPPASDHERPAVTVSHVSFNTTIDHHDLACRLPQPTESPSLRANHGDFKVLGISPGTPQTIGEYLTTDSPQLALHTVSFTDATLVSLTWPHIAYGDAGLADIIKAWSLVLARRDDEVAPILAAGSKDPMATAGLDPEFQDKHLPESQRMQESARQNPSSASSPPPYVSDGDVVSAWLACMAAEELSPRSKRNVVIMTPIDMRVTAYRLFPLRTMHGWYIGKTAQALRRTLMTQTSERQIHALNRLERVSLAENGLPALFGDTSSFLVITTNTTKAQCINWGPMIVYGRHSWNVPVSAITSSYLVVIHMNAVFFYSVMTADSRIVRN